jgi:hypothetical protein
MSGIETECPFDHRHPESQTVNNDLIGIGSTLSEHMEAGTSTVTYDRNKPETKKVKNPSNKYKSKTPIRVLHYQTKDGKPRLFNYPITCAAHHLIPAQASLRECKNLLKYMSSKNDGGDKLKKQGAFNGLVWNDIGYDVNGVENGVFLPGLYAVGGNGTGEWIGAPSALDDEDEEPSSAWSPPPPGTGYRKMTDRNHWINSRSKKWQYVDAATKLIETQFHDSHPAYSRFVLGTLNKMGSKLNVARKKSIIEMRCPKCKERAEKIEKLGIPPPYGITLRLNDLSNRMKTFLSGGNKKGHRQVYTSRWGLAWAQNKP